MTVTEPRLHADDVHPSAPLRHGAYICLRLPADAAARRRLANLDVPALAARCGLRNEFETPEPAEAIAFVRRLAATAGDIADEALLATEAIVHVAAPTAQSVLTFRAELGRLVQPTVEPHVLGGVVRPLSFTGNAMHNFAYAHRVLQQPGPRMPNAFLLPLRKTDAWWAKDWLERHTYFLPRYDEHGQLRARGHALAAEAGIACLLRRTYKHPTEPAPPGAYDFLTYFECADEDVATFHQVCAALRNVADNPEWAYVQEGPTWHGRRVATWAELF